MNKEQQHPQYSQDSIAVASLFQEGPTDLNLAELARLRIRYQGFPGARDIQAKLDQIMEMWELNEEELFQKTRAIHEAGGIYESRGKKEEQDWS
ncbi:DUF3288 family protein [Calothrix sp. NIES-3974]|uniref:DUF3288 family protein n=1 Tax=Calothrix sp. NIES-3974 TaxID=2005462 RepID=UPI000B60346D|nr:DUF3288 family protein [Calothrix sp. NIES-3974]BAZ06483.1 hypothetical protein NIES3974_31440 [Calothrix sp. NIES-3974]